MKNWLVLPVLALLTACVSYYQPESALEDGVYYAEDDPSYRYNPDDYYYTRVVVYPWSSLDSFYFGYWPYAGYGFSFVYPDEPGFAAGYYAFYSPWYSRAYATYYYPPVWRPYRYNCHHYEHCGEQGDDDGKARDDRYAGNVGQNDVYAGGSGEENAFYSHNARNKMGNAGNPKTRRYISKPAAASNSYQGAAVKSKEPAKATKSRAKHVYSQARGPAQVEQSGPSAGAFSGPGGYSPSFSAPSHSRSSGHGSSSRQKDRD